MVRHGIKREDSLSYSEEDHHAQNKLRSMMRLYSRDESFRESLEKVGKMLREDSERYFDIKNFTKEVPRNNKFLQGLLNISFNLLNAPQSETEINSLKKQLTDLEYYYKVVMERFLQKMEKFLCECKELREDLEKTVERFYLISSCSAAYTLVSSAVEVSVLVGSAARKLFNYSWSPKVSFLVTLFGSFGITSLFLALSYMRKSTTEISSDLRQEKRFLIDLMILHDRGNWIDDDVLKIFPHGIDLKLLDEDKFADMEVAGKKVTWKHYLCCVILLTNIQREKDLINDETFLTKVKMFLGSPIAELWWNRKKIKMLLDDIFEKVEASSVKEMTADHEIQLKRTSLYLYPFMIPLLLSSWDSGKLRILCRSLAVTLAIYDLTSNDESGVSEEIKGLLDHFEENLGQIREICNTLDNDYD